MRKMAGSDEPKRKIGISISPEAFEMMEQIAKSRGGSYYSRILEEALRDYHAKLVRAGSLASEPIKVRPARVSDGMRLVRKAKESA